MIPYGRQSISDEDIASVERVLRSDWITQGPAITQFERSLADYTGARHGLAVSNATAGLHLACLALGVGKGDLVWTSPNTFLASANCALYCGADVDFVDIDPRTYNLCVDKLEAKLRAAQAAGRLPKVLIPVHFAGQSCDMRAIHALALQYGFRIIEDASHAVGADYAGGKVGNCRYSDVTVFSFHPVKILTTGEGGMLLSNDDALHRQLGLLRSHGMVRDPADLEDHGQGAWYYEQHTLGYNYRITDIQAALGLSQLGRLDAFVARRRAIAARYTTLLADLPVTTPFQAAYGESAWHLYPVWIQPGADGDVAARRKAVFASLREQGIGVNVHYIPVPTQPYYRKLGFAPGQFPAAEHYYAGAISLPMYFSLSDAEQEQVVDALRRALA
ncbi:MAG: UDP-4-amino-4,6-dideoxy-N-acetyl-beta-L-altrosamine transaminase [Massilia sp.]